MRRDGGYRSRRKRFSSAFPPSADPRFEFRDEFRKRHAESLTDGSQLDKVEASLPHFHLGNERLAGPDLLGELNLSQPRRFPSLAEKGHQGGEFIGVDGLFHGVLAGPKHAC